MILGHLFIFKGSEQIGRSGFVDYEIHQRMTWPEKLVESIDIILDYSGSLEKYFPISWFKDIALIPFNWSSFRKKYWGGLCVGSCQHSVYILLALLSTEVLSPGLSVP